MNRKQLTEIVATLLGYNSQDLKPHFNDIFFTADQLRGQLISDYVTTKGSTVLPQFCKAQVFPVKFDSVRGLNYIDLKSQILGLQNNMGIVQVSLKQSTTNAFIISNVGLNAVTSNLEVGNLAGKQKCWIEGTRIYFYYLDVWQTEIMVVGIPSLFAILDENEELPQPLEFNNMLIEATRASFNQQLIVPQDKVSDSDSTNK